MTPEEQARVVIDKKLEQSGWTIQDMKKLNLTASLGVAVREFPTSTGPVDYALFVDGSPVGVVEAKKSAAGENITVVMHIAPLNGFSKTIASALPMKQLISWYVLQIMMILNIALDLYFPSIVPKH